MSGISVLAIGLLLRVLHCGKGLKPRRLVSQERVAAWPYNDARIMSGDFPFGLLCNNGSKSIIVGYGTFRVGDLS